MNTATQSQEAPKEKSQESNLECNICFEDSTEPVTTTCGHIYCWSCIYKWLHSAPEHNYCPICNNVISEDKIIPLYTKNNTHNQRFLSISHWKANENIPKRPQPQREERKDNEQQNRRNGPWFQGFGTNAFFNTFFAGINFNTPNMRINVAFPALIPMILIFLFNVFNGYFLSGTLINHDDDYNHYNTGNNYQRSQTRSGTTSGSNSRTTYRSSQTTNSVPNQGIFEEGDSLLKFSIMLLLFIGLPLIIKKVMRNNH